MMSQTVQTALPVFRVIEAEAEERLLAGDGPPTDHAGVPLRRVDDPAPGSVRTGVWVGLAAVVTMFAAFTSASVVRAGSADDWEHIALPGIMYANTALLFASSVTLECARRKLQAARGGAHTAPALRWTTATLVMGFAFVAGQIIAWSQLRARGVLLGTGPADAFFYVLTVAHACHVLGGLAGLARVLFGLNGGTLRPSTFSGTAYYWHFMGVLWAYLLLLLWLRF